MIGIPAYAAAKERTGQDARGKGKAGEEGRTTRRTENSAEREKDGEGCGDPSGESFRSGEVEELGEAVREARGREDRVSEREREGRKKRDKNERCLNEPVDSSHVDDEEDKD